MPDEETIEDVEKTEEEEPEQIGGLISNEAAIEIAEKQGGSREELKAEAEIIEARKASDEMKVVLTLKGNRAIVGIQSPDCDPVFTLLEGDLAAVLSQVPALVEAANAKWDASPKYPNANLPPQVEPAPVASRSSTSRTPSQPTSTSQQPMF